MFMSFLVLLVLVVLVRQNNEYVAGYDNGFVVSRITCSRACFGRKRVLIVDSKN